MSGRLFWIIGGPNIITKVFVRGEYRRVERRCDDGSGGQRDAEPQAEECRQLLEAGKDKEMNFLLEPCQHLDFSHYSSFLWLL